MGHRESGHRIYMRHTERGQQAATLVGIGWANSEEQSSITTFKQSAAGSTGRWAPALSSVASFQFIATHAQFGTTIVILATTARMSGLKLYKNGRSPVRRPAMIFLAFNNIPHELVQVDLGKLAT